MSREKKLELSLQSDNGTYYRIDVYNNNAISSTKYTPKLGADGFTLTYQTDNDNRFTGLIPSEVSFDILVTEDGEQAVVNDIRGSVYGGFDMSIWKSSDDVTYELYWAGLLLNDISPEQDISRPTRIKLTAVCGLAPLKDIDFNVDTGYSTPSSFQTLTYFQNIFNNQIGLQDYYWGVSDDYILTSVDWTTDTMTSVEYRDPLVASRFNFMAYVDVDEENGTKKFKSSFDLLDNVCKAFGMRCFLSDGKWHLIQVNNYDNWKAPNTHYYRIYYKNSGTTIAASGSTSYTTTEGTNIKRYGGSFDFLPIFRSVETFYNHLKTYDIPFFNYVNDYPASTSAEFQTLSTELPIWNGFRQSNQLYVNPAPPATQVYSINNSSGDNLRVSLGTVGAATNSALYFSRDFAYYPYPTIIFTPDIAEDVKKMKIYFYARFELEGASDTYYYPLANELVLDWSTTPVFTISAVTEALQIADSFPFYSQFLTNITAQTTQIPVDGDLYLSIFARVYYDTVQYQSVGTEITESTTIIDPTYLYIFSPPQLFADDQQGIRYLLDNELSIKKFFRAFNQEGGSTIQNGVKFEIPELFIGTGPTSGAVGRIETFNYTTSSWETNGMNDTWKAYNTGTGKEITQLLVEEVMKGQASGARVFNGSLKLTSGELNYFEGIEIDGTAFIPYQVSYNANEDTWSGEWYGIDLSSNTLSLVTGVISDIPVANEFTPW
jgi:hypothetical protein